MFSNGINTNLVDIVIKTIPEINILNFYFGIKEIPCLINSPLRVDNNPSFGLRSKDGIKISFKDFSTQESGGTFDLLMKYFHLSFEQVIEKIYNDMSKGYISEGVFVLPQSTRKQIKCTSDKNIRCKIRDWEQYDIEYWEQYGISLKWLKIGNVYPISYIILEDVHTKQRSQFRAEKYAYAYVEFKDNVESLKIYQPFSEKHKWFNKHDSSVWDLWQQLPNKADNLIITSSRKDALCIWENSGIPACSLQAESYLPKDHVVEELKERFKNVFVLYDNDFTKDVNYGEILGKKIQDKYNVIQICLPTWLKVKDTSDLCKKYGREVTNLVINNLVYNYGKETEYISST